MVPLNFSSPLFIYLFTITLGILAFGVKSVKLRNVILLGFSLLFYFSFSGYWVVLLIAIAGADFFLAQKMVKANDKQRDYLLRLSFLVNIGTLLIFKYTWFFTDTFLSFQGDSAPLWLKWVAPIGLSFYIFKNFSYTLDVHREEILQPEKNFLTYLLYVSWFPNVLAGPISRATELLPQFNTLQKPNTTEAGEGFFLIAVGILQKYWLADALGMNWVDRVFDNPGLFSGMEHLFAAYGWLFQLYLDFGGYSLLVMGISLLLGIRLSPNFDRPLRSLSLSTFWKRWHISMSQWFRDYVFTPLNFNWRSWGRWGAGLSVLLTFILSGVWHGPAWTYILWGSLHGIWLAGEILWRAPIQSFFSFLPKQLFNCFAWIITFHVVVFTALIFRTTDITSAMYMMESMFSRFQGHLFFAWIETYRWPLTCLGVGALFEFLPGKIFSWSQQQFIRIGWMGQAIVIALLLIWVFQETQGPSVPFQYLEY
jgi:D-alanyl-lipoteichoic acid acyltransferase DltB (MBOAT superfamily)